MNQTPPRRAYLPELDGLRALSVVSVLLVHATYGRVQGGFLGVDIFFVISGYLITRVIMREQGMTARIDLREFYLRRGFRIWRSRREPRHSTIPNIIRGRRPAYSNTGPTLIFW